MLSNAHAKGIIQDELARHSLKLSADLCDQ
jgi:hypothetical protein